ncbi:MAG: hypothetical protein ACK8QZ_00770, partial [Anaerolineales bacterium]
MFWKRSVFLFLILSFAFASSQGLPCNVAQAQSMPAPIAFLYPLESNAFPTILGLLDVFDEQGNFLSGLRKEELTIFENGQVLPIESLEEQGRPLHLVVAINPGPALGIRDAAGVTRFEKVARALLTW